MQGLAALAALIDGDMKRYQSLLRLWGIYCFSVWHPLFFIFLLVSNESNNKNSTKPRRFMWAKGRWDWYRSYNKNGCNFAAFFVRFGIRDYASMRSEQDQWSFLSPGTGAVPDRCLSEPLICSREQPGCVILSPDTLPKLREWAMPERLGNVSSKRRDIFWGFCLLPGAESDICQCHHWQNISKSLYESLAGEDLLISIKSMIVSAQISVTR